MPWTFKKEASSRNGSLPASISYGLARVNGIYIARIRGGFGSDRETINTGRVLAAKPRSASQTSPGLGLIQQIEHFLFSVARAHQFQSVGISPDNDVGNHAFDRRRFGRIPMLKPLVEFPRHCCHNR